MLITINDRYTGGIISAILELSKPINDEGHNLFISNVSDNSTHILYGL